MKNPNSILHEQLELLSETSKRGGLATVEPCGLSSAMVGVSRALLDFNMNAPNPGPEERDKATTPAALTLTTKAEREIQWQEIKAAAESGELKERDEIRFLLKSGVPASLTVAELESGKTCLVFADCVARRPMYEELPGGPLSWKGSDLRRWANEEFIKELPDDLASIIIPRKIVQTIGDETLETQDKLWAPSVTELFGRSDRAAGDDPNETQLPIFQAERDRVKMSDGQTWWYWTRSPHAGSATNFRGVASDGSSTITAASASNGVCLGLYV